MNEFFQRQRIDTAKLPDALRTKWSASLLDEGFVPFPKKLVRTIHRIIHGPECAKDIAALFAVIDYKRPNLTRLPSLEYLAFVAGLSPDECRAALERLAGQSLITVKFDDDIGVDVETDKLLAAVEREAAV
jgi:hypothetical protein